MAQILPFRRCTAFDPDATLAMGEAYDKAIGTIHPDAESQLVVRELIAKRIIQIAHKGVVDRGQLCRCGGRAAWRNSPRSVEPHPYSATWRPGAAHK
jgi:hypothetical protein